MKAVDLFREPREPHLGVRASSPPPQAPERVPPDPAIASAHGMGMPDPKDRLRRLKQM